MRGVTRHSDMRSWLNSPSPGRGAGGGKKLTGWKDIKTGKGQIDTWLHTLCLPLTVWRHPFPVLQSVDDKRSGTKVMHVWGRGHTCHETEAVLDKMYWREVKGDPSSARDTPPERCGMCKMAEYLWQAAWRWIKLHDWVIDGKAVEDDADDDDGDDADGDDADAPANKGKWVLNKKGELAQKKNKSVGIDPTAILFDFISEADDSENTRIRVGGFCGLWGRDKLPKKLLCAMAASGIRQKVAWKENCMVKPKSVMCVLDNAKPEKGILISEETKELGEKVKEEITKVWDGSEIDIQKKPFAIRWTYDRAKPMNKQYTATAVMKLKPDGRILKAIRGDAPDLTSITTPFNQQAMRANMERHCKIKSLPWDKFFPSKDQEKQWETDDKAEEAANRAAEEAEARGEDTDDDTETKVDDDADDAETKADDDVEADDDDVETDGDGEELVECDKCKKPHKISATQCPHCKHKYDVEEEPEADDDDAEEEADEPEPPKKPVKTRTEAKKEKEAKGTKAKKPAPEPEPDADDDDGEGSDDDDDGDDDDSIPFDGAR